MMRPYMMDSEDEDDEDEGDDDEDEDDEDDEEETAPKGRGKFQCRLCPEKVLLSEQDLEKHVKSALHCKRATKWEKDQAKELESREDVGSSRQVELDSAVVKPRAKELTPA